MAGVAIAEVWRKKMGQDARVLFVGARGGLEEKIIPRHGYPLTLLDLGSLKRVRISKKIRTLFQLPLAFLKSLQILFKERPAAVIGVGGYASGPFVLLSFFLSGLLRIRTAVLEQNAVQGFTNRVLSLFVRRIYSAFAGPELFRAPEKVLVTGNPTRTEFSRLAPAPSRPFVIFIFGGSQGALGMNTVVTEAIPYLKDILSEIRWIHQTGESDFERVSEVHSRFKTGARVEKFIYDMKTCYSQASLVICRSGASSLSELSAVARTAVLIPLPTASDQHQLKNAQIFTEKEAAYLVEQGPGSAEKLAALIRDFYKNPDRLRKTEENIACLNRGDSANQIVSDLCYDP